MAKIYRYITVEEDRRYREIAKKYGLSYTTPMTMLVEDAPKEFDAFEHACSYEDEVEILLI